ncbi:arylsulfatase B-like [Aplysia californica]|uniref:Arylsulfatase B-like n=1 Tax=Aplysia californica TaxID=6500 RepID=A0ABM1A0L0_APLCA|nr:arylsulfatase B-like [Aplysia californica]
MMTLSLRLLFAVWLSVVSGSNNNNNKQPNIVFILADDYGFNDIGYHGSQISTPNLDQLASDGVKLENYYVQPICSPTRGQLMSGRYQVNFYFGKFSFCYFFFCSRSCCRDELLPPKGLRKTIFHGSVQGGRRRDRLRQKKRWEDDVGEWTAMKLRNTLRKAESREEWKRYVVICYLTGSENYTDHMRAFTPSGKYYLDLRDNNGPVHNESGHYSAHLFTEKAIDVVQAHDHSKASNVPLSSSSGMVSALDEGVGNFTQALKDKGLWDNTILVFSTDNGGETYSGGNNFPLRGRKFTLWEGGLHGVGFVTGGRLPVKGLVSNELIHVSDWFPTLVGLAQGSLNGTKPLDGFDMWDTISRGTPSERTVLLHNIDPLFPKRGVPLYNDTFDTSVRAAVRVGDMKLITGDPGKGKWIPPPGQKPERDPDGHNSDKNVWLFNITADPTEHHDLSGQMPETVRTLLGYLERFNETAVPAHFPHFDMMSNPAKNGGIWGPWK